MCSLSHKGVCHVANFPRSSTGHLPSTRSLRLHLNVFRPPEQSSKTTCARMISQAGMHWIESNNWQLQIEHSQLLPAPTDVPSRHLGMERMSIARCKISSNLVLYKMIQKKRKDGSVAQSFHRSPWEESNGLISVNGLGKGHGQQMCARKNCQS